MRLKRLSGIIPILLVTLLTTACKKEAGEGGLATIKGKVFASDLTTSGDVKDSTYMGDQRVFIGVAGQGYAFEDVRTNYEGKYEFRFLRKGDYEVWVYGDCDTCIRKQTYHVQQASISDKKQVIELPDFRIVL